MPLNILLFLTIFAIVLAIVSLLAEFRLLSKGGDKKHKVIVHSVTVVATLLTIFCVINIYNL